MIFSGWSFIMIAMAAKAATAAGEAGDAVPTGTAEPATG